jgi:Lrp/AsnC family transcriptional regulator for asnA, asnC and gidA
MAGRSRVDTFTSDTVELRQPDAAARPQSKASLDDRLNRAIIDFLQRDGRMAFSEIAQELNVSEGTIRNRVNRMKQAGMLTIAAIVDPVTAEYQTDAMLGLKVASGHTPRDVATRLSVLNDVVYILWVSGRYDLLVEVVGDDKDSLFGFLEEQIHSQPDIASVETMMGLKNFKNQFLLKRNWN